MSRLAMVLSVLALVATATGVALATNQAKSHWISGKRIAKGSEPGNRLKANSVTGKEVKESKLKTVASATHADTADNATTADNTNTATTATTANAVGGESAAQLHLSCPSGTTRSADVCFETGASHAAATWTAAIAACESAGHRTLPTPAQLEQFQSTAGQTDTEWTNDLFDTIHAYAVNMSSGAVSSTSVATPTPFRCVAPLSN